MQQRAQACASEGQSVAEDGDLRDAMSVATTDHDKFEWVGSQGLS